MSSSYYFQFIAILSFTLLLGCPSTNEECADTQGDECQCETGSGSYDCAGMCICDSCSPKEGNSCVCEDGGTGVMDCSGTCGNCASADAGIQDMSSDLDTADMTLPDMAADSGTDMLDVADMIDMSQVLPKDCKSDDDCPNGTCASIPSNTPGAWNTCVNSFTDPGFCDRNPPRNDACCASSECSEGAGKCVESPIFYCGGAPPMVQNVCVSDSCASDADCSAQERGVCVPGGAFGEPVARCVYGDCRTALDCNSREGGECTPFFDPCRGRFSGFHCTYEDSVCRADEDCDRIAAPGDPYCAPGVDGMSTCSLYTPPP